MTSKMEALYLKRIQQDAGLPLKVDDVEDESPREELSAEAKELASLLPADTRATYKVEIRAANPRMASNFLARIDLWISGKQWGGGGDDHMFVCGYADCHAPIPPSAVGRVLSPERMRELRARVGRETVRLFDGHWAVCPTCARRGRNHGGRQVTSPEAMGWKADESARLVSSVKTQGVRDPRTGQVYPCIRDCVMIKAPVQAVATVVARFWDALGGDADVYLKYHPLRRSEQIRLGVYDTEDRPLWDDLDELALYPRMNIIKDTAGGASLDGRFRAFLMS